MSLYKYLVVYFSINFNWIEHIEMTLTKTNTIMLHFIHRNLNLASQTTKQTL